MGSIIRLVSCLVSVATILLKCVQQLEWATVFLCCFVKLRSHCCYPCNFQGATNTWPTKNKQAKTYIGDLLGFWHLVFPASIAQTRGENLRWMLPRCLPDASQMLPWCVADASQMLPRSQMPRDPRCPDASQFPPYLWCVQGAPPEIPGANK